jgi:hypothetical protein
VIGEALVNVSVEDNYLKELQQILKELGLFSGQIKTSMEKDLR